MKRVAPLAVRKLRVGGGGAASDDKIISLLTLSSVILLHLEVFFLTLQTEALLCKYSFHTYGKADCGPLEGQG